MRRALLLALLALPLAGFDCGGSDPAPAPIACTLHVAGEVSETLWCVVAISRPNPSMPQYLLVLSAYRTMEELGAGVGLTFAAKPATGTAYGWDSFDASSSVEAGSAFRDVSMSTTHQADAPFGDAGTGKLTIAFSSLPAADVGPETVNVHGSLTATLPSTTTTGADVTLSATF